MEISYATTPKHLKNYKNIRKLVSDTLDTLPFMGSFKRFLKSRNLKALVFANVIKVSSYVIFEFSQVKSTLIVKLAACKNSCCDKMWYENLSIVTRI